MNVSPNRLKKHNSQGFFSNIMKKFTKSPVLFNSKNSCSRKISPVPKKDKDTSQIIKKNNINKDQKKVDSCIQNQDPHMKCVVKHNLIGENKANFTHFEFSNDENEIMKHQNQIRNRGFSLKGITGSFIFQSINKSNIQTQNKENNFFHKKHSEEINYSENLLRLLNSEKETVSKLVFINRKMN